MISRKLLWLSAALLSTSASLEAPTASIHYPDLMPLPPSEFGIEYDPATSKKLLRFSNKIINRGEGRLEVIPVRTAISDLTSTTDAYQQLYTQDTNGNVHLVSRKFVGTFGFHPAHDHWHFGDFARYELHHVAADGSVGRNVYASAEKVSFCLGDNIPSSPEWPKTVSQTYTNCTSLGPQGISPGWIDRYPWWLPDQYLDVTGLPDGEYWLISTVDPSNLLDEGGGGAENNNTAAAKVRLGSEIVWVDDSLPDGARTGASRGDSWNWIRSDPEPFAGLLSHQSALKSGLHQHVFYAVTETLPVSTNNILFAHVFLDLINPPAEVMLQWADHTNWEHRAYWGTNKISLGKDGSASRRYMGPLPPAGKWVRLEVPASQVDLEGHTLTGMYFTLYDGRAAWDSAGVYVAPPALPPVDGSPPTAIASTRVGPLVSSYSHSVFGIRIDLLNGTTPVQSESIKLLFDGTLVTPNISQAGATTTVSYSPPALLASGSSHTVKLEFGDAASPSVIQSHARNFVVPDYTLLPPHFATAPGAVDKTKPGFKIRPYQTAADNPDSLAWTEDQLVGSKGPNLAMLSGTDPNSYFDWAGVINFDISVGEGAGGFSNQTPFPGLPGTGLRDGGTGNAALEVLTYLEFPEPGLYSMGVNSDDGFRVTTGVNALDKFPVRLGEFDGARTTADSLFDILVAKAGIYPFRLIWESSSGGAGLRWFTVHNGAKILVNDTNLLSAPYSVKAYREGSTRAYVKAISPLPNSAEVPGTNTISVTLADQALEVRQDSIRLFLNGRLVEPAVNQAGGLTTLAYTPNPKLVAESTNTLSLIFADNASPPNLTTNEARFVVAPDLDVLVGVNPNQTWRYHESGTDQSADWKETAFDDSAWKSGIALFVGKKGAGPDLPEPVRTTLTIGTNVTTYYFRTHFNFEGNPGAARLRMRYLIDDGAVFYLNGAEIHRVRMPAGPIRASVLAARSIGDAVYEGPVEIPTGALVAGENVLAVEVHQVSKTSSDAAMGVELLSLTSNPIRTTLYSISPSPDAVDVPRSAAVEFTLRDGAQKVQLGSIRLFVNDELVIPTVSKPADSPWTAIRYLPAPGFPAETQVRVRLVYSDDAAPSNVTTRDFSVTTAPDIHVLIAIDDKHLWRYEDSGKDLGTAWKGKDFDDGLWNSGAALFEWKKGTVPALPELVRTSLALDSARTNFYFRTHFNFAGDPAAARLKLKPIIDDGAVFYLNGAELFRIGMPRETITAATLASRSVDDAAYEGPFNVPATSLVAGDNVLAVEVHQSSATSSDVTMGVQLFATGSELSPPPPAPGFRVATLDGTRLKLEWSGSGQLQSADAVTDPWTDLPNASSPFTTPIIGGGKFYRLKP